MASVTDLCGGENIFDRLRNFWPNTVSFNQGDRVIPLHQQQVNLDKVLGPKSEYGVRKRDYGFVPYIWARLSLEFGNFLFIWDCVASSLCLMKASRPLLALVRVPWTAIALGRTNLGQQW